MLDIVIVVAIVLLTGYILAIIMGLKGSAYLGLIPGLIGIATVIVSLNDSRRDRLHDLIKSTDSLVTLLGDNDIIPVWSTIYGITDKDELSALRLLKTAEIANMASNIERISDDYNDSWARTLREWFKSPIMYGTWQKYMNLFQDKTNRLFMRVSM